ncbi:MAG: general stress protein [Bosea sp. (in: a-proteobacteria)]
MPNSDTAIAIFDDHTGAEDAVKKLAQAGFDMKTLSIVGKGFHTEEKVTGFYNTGDRITFWGARGAFWGSLWGLLFGGVFLTLPVMGPVIVVGYLTTALIGMVEGAVIVGGVSALGGALASIGIPKDSVIKYEAAIKADGFLVMAHGSADEVARAKAIMSTPSGSQTDTHRGFEAAQGIPQLVRNGDNSGF